PNLAVRRDVLDQVGGFPPDTMGVESADKPGTVEKIYVGDGDWGLSCRVKAAGYKLMYTPHGRVQHCIPPVRLTRKWWISRHVGEAFMHAFCDRVYHPDAPFRRLKRMAYCLLRFFGHGTLFLLDSLLGRPSRHAHGFAVRGWATELRVIYALA